MNWYPPYRSLRAGEWSFNTPNKNRWQGSGRVGISPDRRRATKKRKKK